jgi:hypothetical protein
MSDTSRHRERLVIDALAHAGNDVRRVGQSAWGAVLRDEPAIGLTVTMHTGWMLVETPLVSLDKPSVWRLLAANGRMRDGARFIIGPPARVPLLRVDVPTGDEQAIGPALLGAFETLRRAATEWNDRNASAVPAPPPTYWNGTGRAAAWRDALAELELPAGEPAADRVELELDSRAGSLLAWLGPGIGGDVMRIELVTAAGLSNSCRDAIGSFLLKAAGVLRGTAPIVVPGDPREPVAFQSVLPAAPDAAAVTQASGALAQAVEHCALEVRALCHEPLAVAYLHPLNHHQQTASMRPLRRPVERYTEPVLHGG